LHLFETGQVISQAVRAGQVRCWPARPRGSRCASSASRFDIWFILDGIPLAELHKIALPIRNAGSVTFSFAI